MHTKAQQLFYALIIFILLNALFVVSDPNLRIHPNDPNNAAALFKHEMREEFRVAFWQTIGDQPFLTDEAALVFDSVEQFYAQTTDATVALLDPNGSDDDLALVGKSVYLSFAQAINNANLRTGDESTNGSVAGESIDWNYDPAVIPDTESASSAGFDPGSSSKVLDSRCCGNDNRAFMTEEPILNIIPEGHVSGIMYHVSNTEPVNAPNSWITIEDNFTGQLYCLAVYNGEVNKYLGECK